MKILVATKIVPEPEVSPSVVSGQLQTSGIKRIIDHSSEASLCAAANISRATRTDHITAVCIGSDSDAAAFKQTLAIGADDAILIKHSEADIDSLSKAALIRRLVTLEEYELVLLGNKSSDNGSGQTAQVLASMLGWPHLSNVTRLKRVGERLRASSLSGEARAWFNVSLPCVIACDIRVAKLNYIRLSKLAAAKIKKIRIKIVSKLPPRAMLTTLRHTAPPALRTSEIVTGTANALNAMLSCLELIC
ncbi:Electron transfer flavoprotein small subunit [Candidatus Hodgkinia cicadicola]|nr:Electron transfer flavoprotein small subunit [Candidatus Hodgkinia cicadicola]